MKSMKIAWYVVFENLLAPIKSASICYLKFLQMRFNHQICGRAFPKQQQILRQLACFFNANMSWICVSIVFLLSYIKAHIKANANLKKGCHENDENWIITWHWCHVKYSLYGSTVDTHFHRHIYITYSALFILILCGLKAH